MIWFWLAVLAALFAGLAIITQKSVLKTEHSLQNALTFQLLQTVISLGLLPIANFAGFLDPRLVIYTVLASIVTAVAIIYWSMALKNLEVSLASPLFALGTAMVVVLAAIFLAERLSLAQYLGIAAVLVGAYLVDLSPR